MSTISPVCTPALPSGVTTLGWMTTDHAGAKRLIGDMRARPAPRAEDRRQIAAAVAVQQIVNDGEAGRLDHAGGIDHLCAA